MKYGLFTAQQSFKLIKRHFHSDGTVMYLKGPVKKLQPALQRFLSFADSHGEEATWPRLGVRRTYLMNPVPHRPAVAHRNGLPKCQLHGMKVPCFLCQDICYPEFDSTQQVHIGHLSLAHPPAGGSEGCDQSQVCL